MNKPLLLLQKLKVIFMIYREVNKLQEINSCERKVKRQLFLLRKVKPVVKGTLTFVLVYMRAQPRRI